MASLQALCSSLLWFMSHRPPDSLRRSARIEQRPMPSARATLAHLDADFCYCLIDRAYCGEWLGALLDRKRASSFDCSEHYSYALQTHGYLCRSTYCRILDPWPWLLSNFQCPFCSSRGTFTARHFRWTHMCDWVCLLNLPCIRKSLIRLRTFSRLPSAVSAFESLSLPTQKLFPFLYHVLTKNFWAL